MKTCKRCFREFEESESDVADVSPAAELADYLDSRFLGNDRWETDIDVEDINDLHPMPRRTRGDTSAGFQGVGIPGR